MNIPYQELQAAGMDLAAVVTEAFLNNFSAAHFRNVPAIYTGSKRFTNFDNDIEIAYQFNSPIQFTLTQIAPGKFKKVWLAHLKARGAASLSLKDILDTPANLTITAANVQFTVVGYQGHTNVVVLTIPFTWNLTARCAVSVTSGDLTLQPVKIELSPGAQQLQVLLRKKLRKLAPPNKPERECLCGKIGNPPDPEWCAKAEQFILFMLNTLLATEMTNFVLSWKLPNAIQLFDGVAVKPGYLSIHDGFLVLGGTVTSSAAGISPAQSRVDTLIMDFQKQLNSEFSGASDDYIKRWKPQRSPTMIWLREQVESLRNELGRQSRKRKRRAAADGTLALLTNDKLVDVLAKRYLSVNKDWSGSAGIDHLVKAEASWWFRVENAAGSIVPGGIGVTASVSVGGSLGLCYFNLDPKHFGDWACNSIAVELVPLPDPPGFAVHAYPRFPSDGIYLSAELLTQAIGLRVPGWPSWANDILGWVTGAMTFPLVQAIALAVRLLNVRVAQYPTHFPGTALEWIPNMYEQPVNAGPYLGFLATPSFK